MKAKSILAANLMVLLSLHVACSGKPNGGSGPMGPTSDASNGSNDNTRPVRQPEGAQPAPASDGSPKPGNNQNDSNNPEFIASIGAPLPAEDQEPDAIAKQKAKAEDKTTTTDLSKKAATREPDVTLTKNEKPKQTLQTQSTSALESNVATDKAIKQQPLAQFADTFTSSTAEDDSKKESSH